MEFELQYHPDKNFVSYLCNGLRFGFDTLIPRVNLAYKECKNLLSARQNPEDVQQLIESEYQKGYLYGPFNAPPFHNNFRVSPIGLAVGKYSGKKRLIVDLSSPHEDPLHVSINDLIDKEACSLTYVKLDDAIKAICKSGKGSLLCKFDISDAYKKIAYQTLAVALFLC